MRNAINWFEIPAVDFERAVAFYSAVLGQHIHKGEFGGAPHAYFSADEGGAAGAIIGGTVVEGGEPRPATGGVVIYLNAGDQIAAMISRVEPAGGKIITPVIAIPPQGNIALFLDSEGNRVGLHSPPQ